MFTGATLLKLLAKLSAERFVPTAPLTVTVFWKKLCVSVQVMVPV
jgi:hypothetical protein